MRSLKLGFLVLFAITLMSATLHEIILVEKSIINNKVKVKIPQEFTLMAEEHLNIKYPGENRPTLVYTDASTRINVAFNHTPNKANQEMVPAYAKDFVHIFKTRYPDAEWKGDGVTEINGRQVGYVELVTPAVDTKIYNLIFFTDLDEKLLLCTFNCTVDNMDHWEPSAKEIMNSLTIK